MSKLHVLLFILAVLITSAAFRIIQRKQTTSPGKIREQLLQKKSSGIGCSTFYNPSADDPIPALTGWGNHSWKITTSSDSAQFYFNQGINMFYAFHIIESRASFDKATRFDSACAMAWWGKALAFGPNINDFGYQRPSEAYSSSTKAKALQAACTPAEKALINAMAIRYSSDTTKDQAVLNNLYKNEMTGVYKHYPGNPEIAALYADALMLLHPWDLYDQNSQPKPWTPEIVKVIEEGLRLNPKHPGANHYYIHAVEASSKPLRALNSAAVLSALMPEVSHITHMPSHIYLRAGNYGKGISVNDKAVAGFNKHLQVFAAVNENLPLYLFHNLHMKINCAQMAGNYGLAISTSRELQQAIPNSFITFGGAVGNYIQYIHQSPVFTQLRFGKWDEILNATVEDSLTYTPVIQHFARGIAYAKTNQLDAAKKELELLRTEMNSEVLKEPFTPFSSAHEASMIAEKLLEGIIAEQQADYVQAIALLQQAVEAEDRLVYNEPRDWILPARQYLGNALLKAKNYKLAEEVFKKDLMINPQNGWSLTGLEIAYRAQKNTAALESVKRRLKDAWMLRDVRIERPVF